MMTAPLGLSKQDMHTVLTTAALAPSLHNSQPWWFRLLPDRIELHADLSRALPATDPEARELHLSCGAALFNLRLALMALGIRPLVTLLPGAEAPGALATVRRGGRIQLNEEMHGLLMAVPARRTNRRPLLDTPVPTAHQRIMVRAAELERSLLQVVTDRSERAQLQRFVVRAYRHQLTDEDVQAELSAWTSAHAATGLGVQLRSGAPRPGPRDEWLLRDFFPGERDEHMPGEDCESGQLMAVLCSFYEGRLGELQAGQAMQRVLLAATTLGLSASFLAQPVEVPGIRAELRRTLGGSLVPQIMLRIGSGFAVPATPRRSVEDLLIRPVSGPAV